MAALKIGGKDARSTARTAPPTKPQRVTDAGRWPDVNIDPFPVDTSLSVDLRASYTADLSIWLDQMIDETSGIARKGTSLQRKLIDPALRDNPHRPDAVKRAILLEDQLIQHVRDVVMTEAEADRNWRALKVPEREHHALDMFYGVEASRERLIGVAWYGKAAAFAWPRGFRLNRMWLSGLPFTVLIDLRIFKVLAWNPSPPPDSLFSGHLMEEEVPFEIRKQVGRKQ